MYKIYVLIDPETGKVRYVGRTQQSLGRRLRKHLNVAPKQSNHRAHWLNSLINKNLVPLIILVEDNIPSIHEANCAEIHYIKHLKKSGCNLTNATEGGGGAIGYKHTKEAIAKLKSYSHKRTTFLTDDDEKILLTIDQFPLLSKRNIARNLNVTTMKVIRALRKKEKLNSLKDTA